MLPIDKIPQEARETVQLTMLLSGIIMIVTALYLLIDPAVVYTFTGVNEETTRLLAILLMIFGLSDTAISLIMFRKKDRK
ncbi:MAG: hypothetical protein KAJ40_03010 [Alphaproteobacteria bacterium]|nr:hypothetical protein [Alphaproteobacteria bacterium]